MEYPLTNKQKKNIQKLCKKTKNKICCMLKINYLVYKDQTPKMR